MQTIGGREPLHGELGRFYDAIENPRKTRGELPILRDAELRAYLADVRERTLDVLDGLESAPTPRTRCSAKASSTRCCSRTSSSTTRRCCSCCRWSTATSRARVDLGPTAEPVAAGPETSPIAAGEYEIGAPPPASPTTTSARATRSSSPPSRSIAPRSTTPLCPLHGGDRRRAAAVLGARRRRLGDTARGRRADRPGHPVIHVSWDAGRRLRPLGRQAAADRARVGGGAPTLEGVGQAWEWTSSDFLAYPGFEAFPYPEYSEVFFGHEHKVLRGGSWATHPSVCGPASATGTCPSGARSSPASAARGTHEIAIDVHLDADAAATMARDVRRGLSDTQGARAEILLRRARLPALRADHRARRVLPDPRRARDPQRALGRDRRRGRPPRPLVELGSGSAAKTRHLLTRCGMPTASTPTSRSTSPRR